jgi:hypothetical protein
LPSAVGTGGRTRSSIKTHTLLPDEAAPVQDGHADPGGTLHEGESQLPSAHRYAVELQSAIDWMAIPPPGRSALAAFRRRPPPRRRTAISIDPSTDAAAILGRVLNEPFVDDDAEDGAETVSGGPGQVPV